MKFLRAIASNQRMIIICMIAGLIVMCTITAATMMHNDAVAGAERDFSLR